MSLFWPCREIGPNGERCSLEAGHRGEHMPLPPGVTLPGTPPTAAKDTVPGSTAPGSTAPPPPPAHSSSTPWSTPEHPVPRDGSRARAVIIGISLAILAGILLLFVAGSAMESGPDSTPNATVPDFSFEVNLPAFSGLGLDTASPSPSTGVRPIGLPIPGATGPSTTTAPAATTAPQPTPGTASGTPGPTPVPLGFGKLAYSGAACFEVGRTVGRRRNIAGAEARYAITVRNPRDAKSRTLWIGIETTDPFVTGPLASRASWAKRPKAKAGETSIVIAGPRVSKGSTRLTWRVFYRTPIDVHARIWIAEGQSPATGMLSLDEVKAASRYVWDVTTDITVCP